MILHVIQWLITGRTMTPLEPSESMDTIRQGVINAGAVLFALALLSTLIFGRWFCGWGCHVVMLQDFCGWLLKRVGIRPRPFRARLLMLVPLALALYMFVWPAVYRWGVAPLRDALHQRYPEAWSAPQPVPPWPGFTLELQTDDFWRTFPSALVAIPFLLICGFATVYFLGAKGFCTYGCPYGGFFAPLDQYARGRIRVTDACEQCGHCTAVCTSNVRVHEEVHAYGMVIDQGCMKCMDCVSVCPNDALYYGFGKGVPSKSAARHTPRPARWDLSWGEELSLMGIFAIVFFGTRGIYGLIPMLMAGGIAICATFMAWKCWRMLRDANVSFHRSRLRFRGRITRSGWLFLGATASVIVFAVHGIVIHGIRASADRLDGMVLVPRAAIFTDAPVTVDAATRAAAEGALERFALLDTIGSGGIALLPTPGVDIRRAWLSACLHEFDAAETFMRRHMDRFGESDEVVRDVAILLSMQGHGDQAEAYLRSMISRHPEFVRSVDLMASWLVGAGRASEGIEVLRETTGLLESRRHPPRLERRMRDAQRHLLRRWSLLEADWGDRERAVDLFRRTIELDPDNSASYALLALLLVELDRMNEAEPIMRQAMDRAVDPRPLAAQMIELLEAKGQLEDAARWRREFLP